MPVKFDKPSHWYRRDGTPSHDSDLRDARKESLYPSPTSIDKDSFVNIALDRWKTNELLEAASTNYKQPHESIEQYAQRLYDISQEKSKIASDFGKEVHDAIEHYPQLPLDPKLGPWMEKFGRWFDTNVQGTVHAEKTLVDHDLGVAGRCDRIILCGDTLVIPDFKTQGIKPPKPGKQKKPVFYESWPRQLSFYAVAYAKEVGTFPKIPACMSVVIDSTEPDDPFVKNWSIEEIRYAYQSFTCACWLWFSKREYWPVGQWGPPSFDKIPMPI